MSNFKSGIKLNLIQIAIEWVAHPYSEFSRREICPMTLMDKKGLVANIVR